MKSKEFPAVNAPDLELTPPPIACMQCTLSLSCTALFVKLQATDAITSLTTALHRYVPLMATDGH